jgi:hypothetical protein
MADLLKGAKAGEDGEWKHVGNKKAEKSKYGTKAASSGSKLTASKLVRSWHLYVDNPCYGTSSMDVSSYLKDNNIDVIQCVRTTDEWNEDSGNKPVSFHIEVPYDVKDKVMDEGFWDQGVRIRNWYFPRKKRVDGR